MTERGTDDEGRTTIPTALRERFGDRYRTVALHDRIVLFPRPEKPLESLRAAASEDLEEATVEERRSAGLAEGRDRAGERGR